MKFSLLSSISSTTFLTVVTLSAAVHAREEEAIFQAVDTNDPEKIREALSKHANNLNAIGPGGQTPLMNAVLRGKGKAVKTLLELGADATIGEKDGYTPLHGAGFQGRPRIAKLLIDHGLDPLDMHKDGYLPIHRACWGREKRHTLTVKTFIDNGGVRHDAASEDGKTCKDVTNNPETLQLLDGVASKEKEDEL